MNGPGFPTYPCMYRQHIYFLSSASHRKAFIKDPLSYVRQPSPGPVVPVKLAIIGPPKCGKTTRTFTTSIIFYFTTSILFYFLHHLHSLLLPSPPPFTSTSFTSINVYFLHNIHSFLPLSPPPFTYTSFTTSIYFYFLVLLDIGSSYGLYCIVSL